MLCNIGCAFMQSTVVLHHGVYIINAMFLSPVRFVFLIVIFILFGCEKKITAEQYEQNVLAEIFSKVVDLTYQDRRIYLNPPKSGEDIYDKNGKWIGRNLSPNHKKDNSHRIKIEALKKDTLSLIIAIGNEGLINDQTRIENFNTRKFVFKHLSELPASTNYDDWTAKYPKFAGILFFSRIQFDVSKEYGTLNVSYYCGDRCGLGYTVTIKKLDDKWVISKVEDTWIA